MCPLCIGSAVLYLTSGGSAGGLALLASRATRQSRGAVSGVEPKPKDCPDLPGERTGGDRTGMSRSDTPLSHPS